VVYGLIVSIMTNWSATEGGPPARTLLRDHESHRATGSAIHKLPKTRQSLSARYETHAFTFYRTKVILAVL
jgi:hypothetical protein